MTVDCVSEGRTLTAAVRGELDHHRAKEVMTELDEQIDMALPRRLTLDLSGLSFTDSSGIAVLIRVSRRMEQIKGELIVRGVPPQPWKVFQAAGLHKLIHVTLPMIMPTLTTVLVLATGLAFGIYTEPFLLTGGGPNLSTTTWQLEIYNTSFTRFQSGYGAAIASAVQIFVTLRIVNFVSEKLNKRFGF